MSENRYIVYGADKNTGIDTNKVFVAPSAQDAEYFANQEGILVNRVEAIPTEASTASSGPKSFTDPHSEQVNQASVTDAYLIVGWLCVFLVPGLGLLIAWYCFDVATKRSDNNIARISLTVVRILVLVLGGLLALYMVTAVLTAFFAG